MATFNLSRMASRLDAIEPIESDTITVILVDPETGEDIGQLAPNMGFIAFPAFARLAQ